ncbi:MAG: Ig-like domain-containing protein [Gemmatimonadales bacterium]
MIPSRWSAPATALLLTVGAGCGGGAEPVPMPAPPPAVSTIVLAPAALDLVPGQTETLAATLRAADGSALSGRPVVWQSSAPAVATVSAAGEVTGASPGTASITVTSGTAAAAADVTVMAGAVIGSEGGTIHADGGSVELIIPAGALPGAVPISVTPVAGPVAGNDTTIRAAYEFGPAGTRFAAPVTVRIGYPPGPLMDSIAVFHRVKRLEAGRWVELLDWTVDPVRRVVAGSTSSFSTYGLGIWNGPDQIILNPATRTLREGEPLTITASITGLDGRPMSAAEFTDIHTSGRLEWIADGAVELSASGLSAVVRAREPGTNLVVALTWRKTPACLALGAVDNEPRCAIGVQQSDTVWVPYVEDVTWRPYGYRIGRSLLTAVPVPIAALAITPDSIAVAVGGTIALVATPRDSAGNILAGRAVTWSTSDGAIASVSAAGLVTGVTAGTVTITAAAEGRTAVARVTVAGSALPVGSILLDAVPDPIEVGGTVQLVAVVRDTAGAVISGVPLTWTAVDTGIVTVSTAGLVTGAAVGTGARVRAAAGGRSSITRITVLPPGPAVLGSPSAGDRHVCLRRTDGTAWCWGQGKTGQLGDGSVRDAQPTPVPVAGGPFAAVSAGGLVELTAGEQGHTCGLTPSGQALCWGSNVAGQLGDGTTSHRVAPVAIAGGPFHRIWAGWNGRTCAVTPGGAGYCWGANIGALGSTTNPIPTPSRLVGLSGVTDIAPGGRAACALAGGTAWCWGNNDTGMLGSGDPASSSVPVAVAGGRTFIQLVAGVEHACGLDTAGQAWCWGRGAIGDGSTAVRRTPVPVAGGIAFAALSAGPATTCGLDGLGNAWCWGALANTSTPVKVPGGHLFSEITAGGFVACGRAPDGTWCWGRNAWGQLGNGITHQAEAWWPVRVRFP